MRGRDRDADRWLCRWASLAGCRSGVTRALSGLGITGSFSVSIKDSQIRGIGASTTRSARCSRLLPVSQHVGFASRSGLVGARARRNLTNESPQERDHSRTRSAWHLWQYPDPSAGIFYLIYCAAI